VALSPLAREQTHRAHDQSGQFEAAFGRCQRMGGRAPGWILANGVNCGKTSGARALTQDRKNRIFAPASAK